MSPVVVLVGAPGAGKTSIGRALAVALNLDFADTDELIESSEDRSVADIFIDDGEDYFRAREREEVGGAGAGAIAHEAAISCFFSSATM